MGLGGAVGFGSGSAEGAGVVAALGAGMTAGAGVLVGVGVAIVDGDGDGDADEIDSVAAVVITDVAVLEPFEATHASAPTPEYALSPALKNT